MNMKHFAWDPEKNERLKADRQISFEAVVFCIEQGGLLDIVRHPDSEKYREQYIFIVEISGYAYLVPFVETDQEVFLKTAIPSRKATRRYLRRDKDAQED